MVFCSQLCDWSVARAACTPQICSDVFEGARISSGMSEGTKLVMTGLFEGAEISSGMSEGTKFGHET